MADAIDNLINHLRPYVYPACTGLAAVGFFAGGQARLVPIFTGKNQSAPQEATDDGLLPLLSRLGLKFDDSTATALIGAVKIAITAGLIYGPTRRDTARVGFGYLTLGLISRLNEGLSPSPALVNMLLIAVPAGFFNTSRQLNF
jgi:hypothetical protein